MDNKERDEGNWGKKRPMVSVKGRGVHKSFKTFLWSGVLTT